MRENTLLLRPLQETPMALPQKSRDKIIAFRQANAKEDLRLLFGSYVGQYLGQGTENKDNGRDAIVYMIQQCPFLVTTGHYTKLIKAQPEFFPSNTKEAIVKFDGIEIPFPPIPKPTQNPSGQVPGVNTSRVNDDTEIDRNDPFDVQVARKLVQLYTSARKRNLEFSLTHEDVSKLLLAKTCYFTDVVLENQGLLQRTIDRLDNTKGYVPGNVVACSYQANQLKSYLFESKQSELYMTPEMVLKFMYKIKHGTTFSIPVV